MVSFLIPTESALGETRVSATPETVKKFLDLGCKVFFEKGAGIAAGFLDIAYLEAGAELGLDRKELAGMALKSALSS